MKSWEQMKGTDSREIETREPEGAGGENKSIKMWDLNRKVEMCLQIEDPNGGEWDERLTREKPLKKSVPKSHSGEKKWWRKSCDSKDDLTSCKRHKHAHKHTFDDASAQHFSQVRLNWDHRRIGWSQSSSIYWILHSNKLKIILILIPPSISSADTDFQKSCNGIVWVHPNIHWPPRAPIFQGVIVGRGGNSHENKLHRRNVLVFQPQLQNYNPSRMWIRIILKIFKKSITVSTHIKTRA